MAFFVRLRLYELIGGGSFQDLEADNVRVRVAVPPTAAPAPLDAPNVVAAGGPALYAGVDTVLCGEA